LRQGKITTRVTSGQETNRRAKTQYGSLMDKRLKHVHERVKKMHLVKSEGGGRVLRIATYENRGGIEVIEGDLEA